MSPREVKPGTSTLIRIKPSKPSEYAFKRCPANADLKSGLLNTTPVVLRQKV
jgi:hypothetical protein